MTWETVIGLEVHAQLSTYSKLFSSSSTQYGAPENSQTSFIDAGLPGTLPVLNQKAILLAVRFGLAIHAQINDLSYFERKNYFYPDLPKGYQISQFRRPIVGQGYLDIICNTNTSKRVIIERAHLEEDAGKSLHDTHDKYTGIDLNRAGTPLLEIVTTPCLSSAEEAVNYLKTLHQLLRFLNICDGNMQEGSFRCDVNLSIKRKGAPQLGTRTELKNLNSFRFIEKAIAFEQQRHQDLLESGEKIIQQTRLYCPDTNTTQPMRDKENESDYRYFTDPDLLPIKLSIDELNQIKINMPPLPLAIKQRIMDDDGLTQDDADFLLSSPAHVCFYDAVKTNSRAPARTIINWLKGTYTAVLNELNLSFENPPISAARLGSLLNYLTDNTISAKIAKQIFSKMMTNNKTVDEIITEEGYQSVDDDSQLETLIFAVIKQYPTQAAEFRAGKEKLLSFFIGQIMKETRGQAAPEKVMVLLQRCLARG
ncbi:MAG: Asp-tRNA(Asn)/Glu-tRNA(Gln) amidotransferase subunit GatB [Legionellaceae bacterium]|nr:Asp-tRNA(Asn)/Glu-tRNA(Gln) amidotransferase subunit GatB [Legionellaceae bacterium]